MKSGRTYEVFVDDEPVGLVGSTILSLTKRRISGYTKRFGPRVELRLIREVPCPENYSDSDYNFRLKAAEAFDIVRKKTYIEDGGLNKISPLIQAIGHPVLETEMGRIGGRISGPIQGRINVENGHLARLRTPEHQAKAGRIGGRVGSREGKIDSGRKTGSIQGPLRAKTQTGVCGRSLEKMSADGRKGGNRTKESGVGIFALGVATTAGRIGMCKRWNIHRGNPCICGKHQ